MSIRPPSIPRSLSAVALRRPQLGRAQLSTIGRRLAHFWFVWSALLLVHEGGHAVSARRQGLTVDRVTVGMGPVLWRGERGDTDLVLRLVPVAGVTKLGDAGAGVAVPAPNAPDAWRAGRGQLATLAGGVLATLAIAIGIAGVVAARERVTRARWVWGRYVVADAVVLTIFNFLPVPPLDGGRAVVGAFDAWHGVPLSGDALFWVHVGGMALAVVPMTLWTRWTARIDTAAQRWGTSALER
jgi:membrane-associated protease RseP (regulator of RpoE activity)